MKIFLLVVVGTIMYLTMGTCWTFLQWRKFVRQELDFYEKERRRFLYFHRVPGLDVPDYLKAEWRLHVERNPRLLAVPPLHEDFTPSLALNLTLWPFSMLFLLGQYVYDITIKRVIVESMSTTNTKINQVKKDLR
jgi:hypothetical protein